MSFLAPLVLAALAAIGLPILLHLKKKQPKDSVQFSSLMFLEESEPTTKTSKSLQDILLLLLRIFTIILLVFAFSRPFIAKENPDQIKDDLVLNHILIDISASMRGPSLEKAKEIAQEIIKDTPSTHRIAVSTYASSLTPLIHAESAKRSPLTDQKQNALKAIENIEPAWEPSHLDKALLSAALNSSNDHHVKLHLISDLQKSSSLKNLADEAWPSHFTVVAHPVTHKEGWTNAGVHLIPSLTGKPKVRVMNASGSEKSEFELQWEGHDTMSIHVTPGESAIFEAPENIIEQGKVTLSGDDFGYDNTTTWITPKLPKTLVQIPLKEESNDPTKQAYYTTRALQVSQDYEVTIVDKITDESPSLIVTSHDANIRKSLDEGSIVLFTVKDNQSANALSTILNVPEEKIIEAPLEDHALLGEIDLKTSIFETFSEARYADFSAIKFWKYRILPDSWVSKGRVIARFDSGDPAWIEIQIGKGTLYIFTSTWRPIDSQFARSTKFPPILHALLAKGSKQNNTPAFSLVGAHRDAPGIYDSDNGKIAILLDPSETKLTPMNLSELSDNGIPTKEVMQSKSTSSLKMSSSEELEHSQNLWWWFILAATLFVIIETLVAALSHRKKYSKTPSTVTT